MIVRTMCMQVPPRKPCYDCYDFCFQGCGRGVTQETLAARVVVVVLISFALLSFSVSLCLAVFLGGILGGILVSLSCAAL